MGDNQEFDLGPVTGKDKKGNPAPLASTPAFSSSDTSLVTTNPYGGPQPPTDQAILDAFNACKANGMDEATIYAAMCTVRSVGPLTTAGAPAVVSIADPDVPDAVETIEVSVSAEAATALSIPAGGLREQA
jgi:hypothetical protein